MGLIIDLGTADFLMWTELYCHKPTSPCTRDGMDAITALHGQAPREHTAANLLKRILPLPSILKR